MLGELPGELFSSILSQIPVQEVRHTVLSLLLVVPHAPIPLHHLYEYIRVGKPQQAIALGQHLRKLRASRNEEESRRLKWIQTLTVELWDVDANIILNVVAMLHHLKSLSLWIGPKNFAPEHLEEMFERPFENLIYLGLRFRPYVKVATYYQFLKGAYFDSTLQALSRWPTHRLPTMSVVQDPFKIDDPEPPSAVGVRRAFAQPIVFFKLEQCVSVLLQAPSIGESLKAFRLRIPSRPVLRSLCSPPLMSENSDGEPVSAPKLEVLDLSTSGVLEGEVDLLLAHYKDLKHLILDECSILRGELREGEWSSLGKRCAMAGARRAKECEKALAAWHDRRAVAAPAGSDGAPAAMVDVSRRPRQGRRGLATATISLRSRSPPPPGRFPSSAPGSSSSRQIIPKFRILPPIPSLKSLCATTSQIERSDTHTTIHHEFEAGWAEGIAQLAVRRARMRDSARLGTVILRFDGEADSGERPMHDLFKYATSHGLHIVEPTDLDAFDTLGYGAGDPKDIPIPVLCLAGSDSDSVHSENCGHSVVGDLWSPVMTT